MSVHMHHEDGQQEPEYVGSKSGVEVGSCVTAQTTEEKNENLKILIHSHALRVSVNSILSE